MTKKNLRMYMLLCIIAGFVVGVLYYRDVFHEYTSISNMTKKHESGPPGQSVKFNERQRPEQVHSDKTGLEVLRRATQAIPVDVEALDGWTGNLGDILSALGKTANWTEVRKFLGLDHQQAAMVSIFGSQTRFVNIVASDGSQFSFRGNDLELVNIFTMYNSNSVPAELTRDDAINAETARNTAQSVLDALGIDEDVSDAKFYLEDNGDSTENDLKGAVWKCRLMHKYKDFHTDAFVGFTLCAYTGRVLNLKRIPLILPSDMEVKLSEDEALKAVATFASTIGLSIGKVIVEDKWIANPIRGLWSESPDNVVGIDFAHPRPAYRIAAENSAASEGEVYPAGNAPPYYIFFVDCGSGEIIGGSGKNLL